MAGSVSGWIGLSAVVAIYLMSLTACSGDVECDYYIQGSSCVEGYCACAGEFVVSGDGSVCLLAALGYGASCAEDVQCAATLGSGGACSSGSCGCADGHHYLQGQCWRSVPLEGACFRDEQCYAAYDFTGVMCQDGFCQCRSEYYRRGNACRRSGSIGEACVFDSDCDFEGGFCSTARVCDSQTSVSYTLSNKSRTEEHQSNGPTLMALPRGVLAEDSCPPGTYDKGTCVPELGTACTNAADDCADGVTYAKCIDDRICGCENSLRARSFDNRACNKVATTFNVTACVEDGQCATFGNSSVCATVGTKKMCNCAEGAHFDNHDLICRLSRLVGETCQVDSDCLTKSEVNVVCYDQVCTCKPGSHVADNGYDCRADGLHVGSTCMENLDCMFDHATCDVEHQQCQCQEHYFAKNDTCVAGIGSLCEDAAACDHIAFASCTSSITDPGNTCQCQAGHVPSANYSTCLPVVEVNEACEQTDQCNTSMGGLKECKEGVCGCQEGAQYILGRCYVMRKLGEKCQARAECVSPGGNPDAFLCQNGLCACQYGHVRTGDECL